MDVTLPSNPSDFDVSWLCVLPSPCRCLRRPPKQSRKPLHWCRCGSRPRGGTMAAFLWWYGSVLQRIVPQNWNGGGGPAALCWSSVNAQLDGMKLEAGSTLHKLFGTATLTRKVMSPVASLFRTKVTFTLSPTTIRALSIPRMAFNTSVAAKMDHFEKTSFVSNGNIVFTFSHQYGGSCYFEVYEL